MIKPMKMLTLTQTATVFLRHIAWVPGEAIEYSLMLKYHGY